MEDFGGGGFMDGSQNETGKSPAVKKTNQAEQRLTSVTVKQVLRATKDAPEDSSYKIDGSPVYNVKIVGCIVEIRKQTTNNVYTIEDGTGRLEVKTWNDTDNVEEGESSNTSLLVEHQYVQAIGTLKEFNGAKHVMAFHIRPIEDFNVLTHHYTEVIYHHLFATRGPLTGGMSSGSSIPNPSGSVAVWGVKQENTAATSTFGNNYASANNNELVRDIFRKNPSDEQGLSISFMQEQLKGRLNEKQIRDAVEFLATEGHLYSSIDDNHYCATGEM